MSKRLLTYAVSVAAILALLTAYNAFAGIFPTPAHAEVYVDTASRRYASPPCLIVNKVEPGDYTVAMSAGEARDLGFEPDKICAGVRGFTQKISFYRRPSRWNADGSWNF